MQLLFAMGFEGCTHVHVDMKHQRVKAHADRGRSHTLTWVTHIDMGKSQRLFAMNAYHTQPTTDLPIHEHAELLAWFQRVLRTRLGPLLATQYGHHQVGQRGSRVRIFDAFFVKYSACGGQRHLPVHRDQSTHSFTIALNGTDCYGGGGTYFCDLARAVVPERGQVLSFHGDLVHGGDPITWGTRYIVVAFTYIQPPSPVDLERALDHWLPSHPRPSDARLARLARGFNDTNHGHRKRTKHTHAAREPHAMPEAVPDGQDEEEEGRREACAVDWVGATMGTPVSFSFGF